MPVDNRDFDFFEDLQTYGTIGFIIHFSLAKCSKFGG